MVRPCAEPAAPASAETPSGERRQITVMFCDLVGSTPLASRLDPEDFREVLAAYHAACAGAVREHEGHVAQLLGDGVLAYFGYPVAREDAAVQAVLAGLAALRALERSNAAWMVEYGVTLSARVGIHTGLTVIGQIGDHARRESLAMGDTVNIAARVQGEAEPNTVVITAATYRLVAGAFVVQPLGVRPLKGIAEPVTLHRVERAADAADRRRTVADELRTTFVGRSHERRLLAERWALTRAGDGQVLLILGEAGIGKSRLVEQLGSDVRETPHAWAEACSSRYLQHTPFGVVRALLERGFGWSSDLSPDARLEQMEQALAAVGLDAREGAALLGELLGLPTGDRYPPLLLTAEQQRKRTMRMLVAWVRGLAQAQPLVVVIEDLHWADPSTLEAIGLLLEEVATLPVLLVLTARSEFAVPWTLRSHCAQLVLNRLTRGQAREMIAEIVSRHAPALANLDALVARTDGVPLFAEELARAVAEQKADAVEGLDIPATLQDSLLARLDRLGPAKEIAQLASVIGREFSYLLLRSVVDDAAAVEAGLARLVDGELVYARGVPPDATYVFKHALVQQAAYDSLLKRRRREVHGRVARALSGPLAGTVEGAPELVAEHWTQAGDAERAVAAWDTAAARASSRSAWAEASTHYANAVAALGTMPETPERAQRELEIQLRRAAALQMGKGFLAPEAVEAVSRARVLGEQIGGAQQRVPTLMGLWTLSMNRGELSVARELADQILAAAAEDDDPTVRCHAHVAQAGSRVNLGDLTGALEHADRAMAVYDAETERRLVFGFPVSQALLYGALAAALLGLGDQARARCDQLLEHADRHSDDNPALQPLALVSNLVVRVWLREVERVIELSERLLSDSMTAQMPLFAGWGRIYGGWAKAMQGRPAVGIPQLRQGLMEHASSGQTLGLPQYLGLLAEAELAAGASGDGMRTIERVLGTEAPVSEEKMQLSNLLRIRADLRAAEHGAARLVEASYVEAIEVAQGARAKLLELRAATGLARFLVAQGRAADARRVLAPVRASFTEGFDLADLADADGVLVAQRSDPAAEAGTSP